MAASAGAKRCFVFGYGSLINASSRAITMGSLTASSPAEIIGLERQFCVRVHFSAPRRASTCSRLRAGVVREYRVRGPYSRVWLRVCAETGALGCVALGVVANAAASTNGVVFEVRRSHARSHLLPALWGR